MWCPPRIRPIEPQWGAALLIACACVDPPSPWEFDKTDAQHPEAWFPEDPQSTVALAEGPSRHDAFAWQRHWTPAVREAVAQPSAELDGLIVLMGEVEWPDGPQLVRTEADLTLLAASDRPVGAALRVGMPPSGWGPTVAEATVEAVEDLRAASETSGFQPSELHLDIDVPTSRLDSYASWLPRVRAAWPSVPLTITGLPTWLESGSLPAVLDTVDGWVLQVGVGAWLRLTSGPRSKMLVCQKARGGQEMAARKQSKVAQKYKTKYRVQNWAAYEKSLRCRGDLTVWFDEGAIEAWNAPPSGRPGGQWRYSDLAILTALTLRTVFHLAQRQTEGFVTSLIQLMGLYLKAPDHTTLSRRSSIQEVPGLVGKHEGPLHLVIDSTGLKILGGGEWHAYKHRRSSRHRSWRKSTSPCSMTASSRRPCSLRAGRTTRR